MKEPTFSICIPNYNYGRYIGEAIQSVLDQTYQNFEIIVADNASTDNSVEVIQSFKDDRIRLIRNRYNIGFAPNLQRATMCARNDFINLLSADDLMKPCALETYAEILVRKGVEAYNTVLTSLADGIDSAGQVTMLIGRAKNSFALYRYPKEAYHKKFAGCPLYREYRGREVFSDCLRRLTTGAMFCTIVYPRRLWQAVEGYNGIRNSSPDSHFFIKLMSLDPIFIYVNRTLFCYRRHDNNQTASQKAQRSIVAPIDQYFSTLEFTRFPLDRYNLSGRDLIRVFVERDCLTGAFVRLAMGEYSYALRLWALALATYPTHTVKSPKFYALTPLLLLGPLSRLIAFPIWRLFGGRTVSFDVQRYL